MTTDARHLALLFRVRTRLCALPVASLREVMRPLPILPLAAAPDFVLGAARVRGRAVPVVDAGALLGAPEAPAFSRFVTLRAGENCVALAVEAVIGVRMLAEATRGKLPPLLREAGRDVLRALETLDAELLSVLELARTVTDQALGAIEQRAAP